MRIDRPAGQGIATLVDVARAANVSIATASRAINGRPSVSAATRARVLEAAAMLRFQPSPLARGFRAQRSLTIGMIVPDLSSPFYAAALRGAQHALYQHGYTILVCDTEEQARREGEVLDLLAGHRVAGLILAPVSPDPEPLRRLLARQQAALVVIDNRLRDHPADTVLVDNVAGGPRSHRPPDRARAPPGRPPVRDPGRDERGRSPGGLHAGPARCGPAVRPRSGGVGRLD